MTRYTLTQHEDHWILSGDLTLGLQMPIGSPTRLRVERGKDGQLYCSWPTTALGYLRMPFEAAVAISAETRTTLEMPDGQALYVVPPGGSGSGSNRWTLASARAFVAERLWPVLYANGWVPCITGGVLHRGWSDNDLDIVLYPRTGTSTVAAAQDALASRNITWEPSEMGLFGTFSAGPRRVEVVIPCR